MASNTYVALKTSTVTGSPAATVLLDNIPQGYTDLVLVVQGRFDSANQIREFRLRFNGDTGTNYSSTRLIGDGSSASSDRLSNFSNMRFGVLPAATAGSGIFGNSICHIQNYANTSVYKTVLNRTNDSQGWVVEAVGLWRNTAAITSVEVAISETQTGNWVVGSTFTLYGIAAASVGAKATGGTIYQDASYFYHVFSGNGTFTPSQVLSADILVLAGGGGGADNIGGGGAAGGLRVLSSQSLSSGVAYTATVGGGGNGGPGGGGQANGAKGTNSSFSGSGFTTISSTGGGYGAIGDVNGGTGGSGGGTRATVGNGGTGNEGGYSPVEGYNGGKGATSTTAGGGGGAGAVGQTAPSSTQSGAGGAGSSTYSSWGVATGIGQNNSGIYYLAGGGAGGGYPASSVLAGAGGIGGGGAGGYGSTPGTSGLANTGSGGGGGSSASGTQYPGGNGGSGIVIVRYAK